MVNNHLLIDNTILYNMLYARTGDRWLKDIMHRSGISLTIHYVDRGN